MKQRQQPHGFPGVAKKALIGFGCLVMRLQLAEVRTCPDDLIRCGTQSARLSADALAGNYIQQLQDSANGIGLSGRSG